MLYEGSEVTEEALIASLDDGAIVTYIYFGAAMDGGGQTAQSVEALFPYLDVFITSNRTVVTGWFGNRRPRGVLFRLNDHLIHAELTKAQTEDQIYVENEVMAANSEG